MNCCTHDVVYLLFKYIASLIQSQHMCLYWKVYIVRKNNNMVSLNEVNCSSVVPKSRNKKWARTASETNSLLICMGFTYTDCSAGNYQE